MHHLFPLSPPKRARGPAALGLALALAVAPSAVLAQATTDFRLEPGATPRAPGPVDPDNPAARSPSAAPAPRAAPAPAPTAVPPLALPPAPTSVETSASPTAPTTVRPQTPGPASAARRPAAPPPVTATAAAAPDRTPEDRSGTTARPAAAPAVAPLPTSTAPALAPIASAPTAIAPSAAPSPAAPASETAPASGGIAWWWLVPAALGGALAAWLFARRRLSVRRPLEFVPPRAEPARDPAAAPPPREAEPAPAPAAAATPAPATSAEPLELVLDPLRFSVTLVNATLQYRLRLTNHSAAPLGPLAIAADMIAAHASLPEDAQLGRDGRGLELRHELPALAPGETVELKGDLRLPLAAVTPIRAGTATLLVPLVRLRVEGAGPAHTAALVIGEQPASPDGPLRPFRLDQGPRIFAAVSQRALAA